MRKSLKSVLFCFVLINSAKYPPPDYFFFCLVWLNFTGRSKMDINVSQMESQDIIKVVLTKRTTYTNVSLRVIIIQLFFIVRKEKNIEKLIITIMMIISFNN